MTRALDHRLLLAAAFPLCLLAAAAAADQPAPIGIYAVPPEPDVVAAYAPAKIFPPPPRIGTPAEPATVPVPRSPDFSTRNDLEGWPVVRSRANLGYEEPALDETNFAAAPPLAVAAGNGVDSEVDPYPFRERGLSLSESQRFRGKFKARNGSAVISVGIGF